MLGLARKINMGLHLALSSEILNNFFKLLKQQSSVETKKHFFFIQITTEVPDVIPGTQTAVSGLKGCFCSVPSIYPSLQHLGIQFTPKSV